MTKEDFVKRWRHKLAGLALFGVVSETKDGPLKRAANALDIPQTVETLLAELYDDAASGQETSIEQDAELMIARWEKESVDNQKKVVDKCRAAFTNGKVKT